MLKELNQKDYKIELLEDLGMLYAKPTSKNKTRYAMFRCSICLNPFKSVAGNVRTAGITKCMSCRTVIRNTTHGENDTPLHNLWNSLKARCDHDTSYTALLKVRCKEWDDFLVFRDWALANGYSPSLTIDRRNNDLGYSPDNCRFVTMKVQARNKRVLSSVNTSGYKGVSKANNIHSVKWCSYITVDAKRHSLGVYSAKLEAAKAYDSYVAINNLEHSTNGLELYSKLKDTQ